MAIIEGINKLRPYANKINGKIKTMLSSKHIFMDDGSGEDKSLQDAVTEMNKKIKDNVYADGYVLVDCGSLPNATDSVVPIGLPQEATNWWIAEAWFTNPTNLNRRYTLPHIDIKTWNNSVSVTINNSGYIALSTLANWTGYNAYVIVAYKL